MKRRIFSLIIVLVMCLLLAGNTMALSSDDVVQPRSAIVVTCGLTSVSGQYKAWARTESNFTDTLTARVSLYRVINGVNVYVTSASASTTGTSVTASRTLSLASGTYKVYGYGTSSTTSGSVSHTYVVP